MSIRERLLAKRAAIVAKWAAHNRHYPLDFAASDRMMRLTFAIDLALTGLALAD